MPDVKETGTEAVVIPPPGDGDEAAPYDPRAAFRRTLRGGKKVYYRSLVVYVLLLVAGTVATQSKIAPYNVRELLAAGGGLGLLAFPLGVFLVFAPPVVFARWCSRGGWERTAFLPGFVLAHALVIWAGVRVGAPLAAIHDVVGFPTLGWPGELEIMGRFVALFGAVTTLFVGGAHVSAAIGGPHVARDRAALARWAAPAAFLLLASYLVVVRFASTQKVVELMAGGGRLYSAAWIGGWILNVAVAATSLAAALRLRANVFVAGLIVAGGIPLGWMAIQFGTASVIDRHGEVFSAIQFLLSADRRDYSADEPPFTRYFFAHLGLVFSAALVQMPFAGHRRAGSPVSRG